MAYNDSLDIDKLSKQIESAIVDSVKEALPNAKTKIDSLIGKQTIDLGNIQIIADADYTKTIENIDKQFKGFERDLEKLQKKYKNNGFKSKDFGRLSQVYPEMNLSGLDRTSRLKSFEKQAIESVKNFKVTDTTTISDLEKYTQTVKDLVAVRAELGGQKQTDIGFNLTQKDAEIAQKYPTWIAQITKNLQQMKQTAVDLAADGLKSRAGLDLGFDDVSTSIEKTTESVKELSSTMENIGKDSNPTDIWETSLEEIKEDFKEVIEYAVSMEEAMAKVEALNKTLDTKVLSEKEEKDLVGYSQRVLSLGGNLTEDQEDTFYDYADGYKKMASSITQMTEKQIQVQNELQAEIKETQNLQKESIESPISSRQNANENAVSSPENVENLQREATATAEVREETEKLAKSEEVLAETKKKVSDIPISMENGRPVVDYENGTKHDFTTEAEAIKESTEALDKNTQAKKENAEVSDNQSSSTAFDAEKTKVDEVVDAENTKFDELKNKLNTEIPEAISKKNDAFTEEQNHVSEVVEAEKGYLDELKDKIKEVSDNANIDLNINNNTNSDSSTPSTGRVVEADAKNKRKYEKKAVRDDDISNDAELARKRAEAVERVGRETTAAIEKADNSVIKAATNFYDSQDRLVKMQIKSIENTEEGLRQVTTTIKFDKKDNEAYASDIYSWNYDVSEITKVEDALETLIGTEERYQKLVTKQDVGLSLSPAEVGNLESLNIEREKANEVIKQQGTLTEAQQKIEDKWIQKQQEAKRVAEAQTLALMEQAEATKKLAQAKADEKAKKAAERESKANESKVSNTDNYNGVDKGLSSLVAKISGVDASGYMSDTRKSIESIQKELEDCDDIITKISNKEVVSDDEVKRVEKLKDDFAKIDLKDKNGILANQNSVTKLIANIRSYMERNSGMSKQFKNELQGIIDNLEKAGEVSKEFGNNSTIAFNKTRGAVAAAGQETKSFADMFTSRVKSMSASALAMYFSFYDIIRYARELADTVKEVNSAQIELRKVSEASDKQLTSYWSHATESAKEYGATITEVINSAADWSRLGYNIEDAEKLADATTLLLRVGDNMTQESSSEGLISTLKGFGKAADEAEHIVDVANEVANTEPIDTAGLFEGLQKSASSLDAANNSLEQSIALITTANSVVQDPSSVGTAFKTISMRIRSAKSELEEMGEDTEGMVESTAKLREEIKALSGVDIMSSDDEFKSTYQILDELADKWQDLTDIQQANYCLNVQKCA